MSYLKTEFLQPGESMGWNGVWLRVFPGDHFENIWSGVCPRLRYLLPVFLERHRLYYRDFIYHRVHQPLLWPKHECTWFEGPSNSSTYKSTKNCSVHATTNRCPFLLNERSGQRRLHHILRTDVICDYRPSLVLWLYSLHVSRDERTGKWCVGKILRLRRPLHTRT